MAKRTSTQQSDVSLAARLFCLCQDVAEGRVAVEAYPTKAVEIASQAPSRLSGDMLRRGGRFGECIEAAALVVLGHGLASKDVFVTQDRVLRIAECIHRDLTMEVTADNAIKSYQLLHHIAISNTPNPDDGL